jgi:hypothetical protein
MGYSQWTLVQDSDLAFGFLPDRRYAAFHAGNAPLPQARPGEVRTVEVLLYLEHRRVTDVLRLDHVRFTVLADGVRDPAAMEWELSLVAQISPGTPRVGPGSATRRFAERQIAGAFHWSPDAIERKAIADAISRRAKQPLLGGRPIRLVQEER